VADAVSVAAAVGAQVAVVAVVADGVKENMI
jgi:hypothetical protein